MHVSYEWDCANTAASFLLRIQILHEHSHNSDEKTIEIQLLEANKKYSL
jgi:hypothetical protein